MLKIVPERCISLHEGQVCYQEIKLSWQLPAAGNYCLYQEEIQQPLKCWQDVESGELELDFQSASPLKFSLYQQGSENPLVSSTVSVSWVYKSTKRQRRNWRLF